MQTSQREYYPYFDYLRIFLAIAVMIGHAGFSPWQPSGKLAVDVFFALSGWLIGTVLLRTRVTELPKFYFNRAIRIWIPYYIALVLLLIPSLLTDTLDFKWLEFVIYKGTQVYNIFGSTQLSEYKQMIPLNGIGNHFWSVNAEEQFYLVAPLIIVVLPVIGKEILTWITIVAIVWVLWIYPPISLGVLAAVINFRHPEIIMSRRSQFICTLLLIVACWQISKTDDYHSTIYQLFSPILSISLVLLLARKGKMTRVGRFLGGVSYPLYLNHWIGIVAINKLFMLMSFTNTPLKIVLFTLVNISLAGCLYWYIERLALAHRARLFSHKRGVLFVFLAYGSMLSGIIFGVLNL